MRDEQRLLRRYLGAFFVAAAACALPACVYDADNPCGEGGFEVDGDGELCVCPDDTVLTPEGCLECGDHEVATASSCECEDGYARPSAGEPCEEVPSGLGAECDPADSMCPAEYDHCEPAGDAGYCTSADCTSSDDCEGGYACNADSICERPPVGLGASCSSPEDCAGTEATFCESVMTMTCQVEGCSLTSNDCFEGYACCDLSTFGVPSPLCLPTGACPT
jgi:hypothetical protein